MFKVKYIGCLGLFIFFQFTIALFASEYYVSPIGSASNPGTQENPWSLAKANSTLQPGDIAILMDGSYTGTPIAPASSGQAGNYITYKVANRHMAVFTNISELPNSRGPVAIFVNSRSYISVDGIKVTGVKRWVMGVASHHITLSNGHFEDASGWINCRFDNIGNGMRIINNYFHGGTDLVSLDGGDGHWVEGNFFGDASHTGLVLLGVQRSVVRNNEMMNRLWRCMEVESQRHEPFRKSKYNLIEKNVFDYSPCKSIQYAGNNSIIRKNIFRRSLMGMGWSNYLGSARTPEAWHDEHNRFYNNVIAECGSNELIFQIIQDNAEQGINVAESVSDDGYGMVYTTNLFNPPVEGYDDCAYGDNIVANNIFYKNENTGQGKSSKTAQLAFDWNATPEFGRYHSNNFFSGQEGSDVFYFLDGNIQDPPVLRNSPIDSFQTRYPNLAINNIEVDPQFIDPNSGNYHLQDGSQCIDAGINLTRTVSSGSGNAIKVEDALFFSDGYGLVTPDMIRVGTNVVKLVEVNYDSNIVVIDQSISWQMDDPVSLDFVDDAPDIGALEYGAIETGIKKNNSFNRKKSFNLFQNFPNPFNPNTRIKYEISSGGQVLLEIYNIAGQKVKTLLQMEQLPGQYHVNWDGKDEYGKTLSSSVYFYQLIHNNQQISNKMILLH